MCPLHRINYPHILFLNEVVCSAGLITDGNLSLLYPRLFEDEIMYIYRIIPRNTDRSTVMGQGQRQNHIIGKVGKDF